MQTMQSVDDTEIVYEQHGDGRSLILLHGGMAPREYWNPVIPHFEKYTAVVPERPGFGTCLDGPGETSAGEVLERETNYVRTLVNAVEDDPILFGTAGPDFLRESARSVHQALPHSRLVEFDDISHGGPSEAPELISAEVHTFLHGCL